MLGFVKSCVISQLGPAGCRNPTVWEQQPRMVLLQKHHLLDGIAAPARWQLYVTARLLNV